MPVYAYVCQECGARFEQFHRYSESGQLTRCPNGHSQIRKVWNAPAVQFKGKGFYVTDQRAKAAAAHEYSVE